MKRMIALLCFLFFLNGYSRAEETIPDWVLPGILHVETRSYYAEDGFSIVYVDTRRGRSGERGPFQMSRSAFNQVSEPGEVFADLESDPKFAEIMARRYLLWIFNSKGNGSWKRTVAMWNTGPSGYTRNRRKGDRYYGRVYAAGMAYLAEVSKKNESRKEAALALTIPFLMV